MATTQITAPMPIMMPSTVRMLRILFRRRALKASRNIDRGDISNILTPRWNGAVACVTAWRDQLWLLSDFGRFDRLHARWRSELELRIGEGQVDLFVGELKFSTR